MKSPFFNLLELSEDRPVITNLVPFDNNLNRDPDFELRYESSDPTYVLQIDGTSVPASYLTPRLGRGRIQSILKVVEHENDEHSFDWVPFVPGQYYVYLLSNQKTWAAHVRGQLVLSKYGSPTQSEIRLRVDAGSELVELVAVKLGEVLVNAQVLNGYSNTYTINLLSGDPNLFVQDSYLVLSDPGISPTRTVGDTVVSTFYLALTVDSTEYRKPFQVDPKKRFTLTFPDNVTTCNVYISSDEPVWDRVNDGLRAGLILVETATDPSHIIFPVSIGGGQVLHADYVGQVTIRFVAEENPITLESGYSVSNLAILQNPTGYLSIIRNSLVYRGPESRIINGTVVNTSHLTLSSKALSIRPPVSKNNKILFDRLSTRTEYLTGSYGVFTTDVNDAWNNLLPGLKGQAFLAKKPQISAGHSGGTPESRWVFSIAQITQNKTFASSVVYGSKLYTLGGTNAFGQETRTMSSYDFITKVFKTTGYTSSPIARSRHTAVVWGDKMYVVQFDDRRLDIYNFSTNQWSRGADLPIEDPDGFGSVRFEWQMLVWNGKIVISGGVSTQDSGWFYLDPLDCQVLLYDISLNLWTQPISRAPVGRRGHAAAIYNDKLYVWGGHVSEYSYDYELENEKCERLDVYDLNTNQWESFAAFGRGYTLGVDEIDPINRRSRMVHAVIGSDWYLMGGDGNNYEETSSFCDIYNFESNTWTIGVSFPEDVIDYTSSVTRVGVYENVIYAQSELFMHAFVLGTSKKYSFCLAKTAETLEASHIGNVDLQFDTNGFLTAVTKNIYTDPRVGFDSTNSNFIIQTQVGSDVFYDLLIGYKNLRSPLHVESGELYKTNEFRDGNYAVYIANGVGWVGDFQDYRFEMFLIPQGEAVATTLSFSNGRAAKYVGAVNLQIRKSDSLDTEIYLYPFVNVIHDPNGALSSSRKYILRYTGTHPYGRSGNTYLTTSHFYRPYVHISCYPGTDYYYDMRFSSELPLVFNVYLTDLSDNWDKLDINYRGCLFLVDERTGDLGSSFLLDEITNSSVGILKLGKVSAKVKLTSDPFSDASGVEFEDLVVLPGSDPYLVARSGQLYLDDTLPRNVNGVIVPTNYLNLEFRLCNYKPVLSYHELVDCLGPVSYESGDYFVYIGSNQSEWDIIAPDYRANLFLSKDSPDVDEVLRYSVGSYTLSAKRIGRVSLDVQREYNVSNYHLFLNESKTDFFYQDAWDSAILVSGQSVDASNLKFSLGKLKYKFAIDYPGSKSEAVRLSSSSIGEHNVYLANNDLNWDRVGSSYRSNLFLSKAEPETSGLLKVFYDSFGNYVEALRLGRIDVNWTMDEPEELLHKRYRVEMVLAYNPRLQVMSDYDLQFKGQKKMSVDGTSVDASFLNLRSIYGRYRDPLISYTSQIGLDVLTTGNYYVYLAPNDKSWGRYAQKMFLSKTVPVDGWFVCSSVSKRAVCLGEVNIILDSVTSLPKEQYYFEILSGSSGCLSVVENDVVYKTKGPFHGVPASRGSYRLLSSYEFSLKKADGSYRDCVDLSTSNPTSFNLEPGFYNIYFASDESIWKDLKLNLFLSPTPPFREKSVFLTDYLNNETGSAAWVGRVLVKSTPSWSIKYDEFFIGKIKDEYLKSLHLNYFGDLVFNDESLSRTLDGETVVTTGLLLDLTRGGLTKNASEFVNCSLSEGDWNVYVSSGKEIWENVWETGELFLSQLSHFNGKLMGTIDGVSVESLYVGKVYIKPWNKDLLAGFQDWGALSMTLVSSEPASIPRKVGRNYFRVGGSFFAYVRLPEGLTQGFPFSIRLTIKSENEEIADFYRFTNISFTSRLISSEIQDYQILSECEDFSQEFGVTRREYTFFKDSIYGNRVDFKTSYTITDDVGSIGMLQPGPRDILITKISLHYNNAFDEQSGAVEIPGIPIDKVELLYK
jgi:hypothetical protein